MLAKSPLYLDYSVTNPYTIHVFLCVSGFGTTLSSYPVFMKLVGDTYGFAWSDIIPCEYICSSTNLLLKILGLVNYISSVCKEWDKKKEIEEFNKPGYYSRIPPRRLSALRATVISMV